MTRPVLTTRTVPHFWEPGVMEAIELYDATSAHPFLDLGAVPPEYARYLNLVYSPFILQGAPPVENSGRPAVPWVHAPLPDSDGCWVAFSGGKDSATAALSARDMGYRVTLYYLAGLNRGQGFELSNAQRLARRLDMPLIVERVHVAGAKDPDLTEVPSKNQVSNGLMLARMAVAGGSRRYTGGWQPEDTTGEMDPTIDWSDCAELLQRHHEYMAARYPGLEYVQTCEHEVASWARIASEGLLGYVNGCVCPPRYFARVRAANERKFGRLLPGRCGSCSKCAWEEYALQNLGVLPRDDARIDHGVRFLKQDFGGHAWGGSIVSILNKLVPNNLVGAYWRDAWPIQEEPDQDVELVPHP